MKTPRKIPRAEILEDRTTPATWGNPWPDATHLTLSFAPDGTQMGSHTSDLFQTLNAIAPTQTWETVILHAFQTWASEANLNIAIVPDDGLPFGTPGAIQSDARFGDIRIGAYAMPTGTEATASPFIVDGGTWSGDVELNSAASFGIGGSGTVDLYTVMLHEAGHVFGFADNSNPASVLDTQYLGVRAGLGAVDIAALQNLYGGARSLNQTDGVAGHSQMSTAIPLSPLASLNGSLSMTAAGDVSTLSDRDFYSFPTLLDLGDVNVTLDTADISLLTPSVTIYNASGKSIITAVTTNPQAGGFEIHLSNVAPLTTYYIEVQSGQQNPFGIGSYDLTIDQLPLINSLLGTVTATVTQGVTAVTNTLIDNDPLDLNNSFATATPLAAPSAGANGNDYDTYESSFASSRNVDYYKVQAPPAAAGASTDVLTAMVWGLQNQLDPSVRVYNADKDLIAAQVLVNDGYSDVLQIADAQPKATYYVEVLPGGASDVGNYFLGLDFSAQSIGLQNYAGGTLTTAQPDVVSSLTAPVSGLYHFVLSADAAGSAQASVVMTITGPTGNVVFTLTAGAEPFTGNVLLDPGAYTISFAPGAGSALPLTFQLLGQTLTDPQGPESSDPTEDSSSPYSTLTAWNPGDQANLGGDNVYVNVQASASDGDALAYSATGLPAGLSIDPNYGDISGAIADNAASTTPYLVTVTVSDGSVNESVTQTFNWTVNPPVVILSSPGDQTNLAGDNVYINVSAGVTDSYPLTFSATGLPPGLSIDPNYGDISGAIPDNAANAYAVTVTATDSSSGVSASVSFNWTVNPPVVTLSSPGAQTNLAGDNVYINVSASVTDSYPLTFSATGLPPGLSIDPNYGDISGAIPDNAANAYVVSVTATDTSSGVSASVSFNWTVNPPVVTLSSPGNQSNLPGDNIYVNVSAGDSDNYPLTFSATGLPAGLSIDPNEGDISGTIASNAASANPYVVTITATDASSGVSSAASFDWTVNASAATPPSVSSVVVNGNTSSLAGVQRTMVDGIVYTFSEPVNLSAGAFSIAVHSGETGTVPTLSYSSPDGGTRWVVTFSGNGVIDNSIGDGVYDITLNASAVSSEATGADLSASRTDTFYRLFGDVTGSERVNSADESALEKTYGKDVGASGYSAYFDLGIDYSGAYGVDAGYTASRPDTNPGSVYETFLANYGKRFSGFTPTI